MQNRSPSVWKNWRSPPPITLPESTLPTRPQNTKVENISPNELLSADLDHTQAKVALENNEDLLRSISFYFRRFINVALRIDHRYI